MNHTCNGYFVKIKKQILYYCMWDGSFHKLENIHNIITLKKQLCTTKNTLVITKCPRCSRNILTDFKIYEAKTRTVKFKQIYFKEDFGWITLTENKQKVK